MKFHRRRIARLAQEKVWFDDEFRSARRNLQLICEHLMSCDGLSLWMERLPLQKQDELLDRMREIRQQGTDSRTTFSSGGTDTILARQ